jgi:large subunit ribosomal protein L18
MTKRTRSESRERRHTRVRLTVHGTPNRPRLNVFRSVEEIYAQIIDDEKGVTLAAASSIDHEIRETVAKLTKTEQAKAVGELVAKRAIDKGIKQVVFDRGGFRYIGRVKALADAARQAGLDF